MRRLTSTRDSEDDSSVDVTPMLDVVFIMLIFFIVTASFVKEAGIDVNRPQASTGVRQAHANILVAISDRNEIWIDRKSVDIRRVRAVIERLHAENPKGAVVIQADRASTTDMLIRVMDAARAAGVFDIAIATES